MRGTGSNDVLVDQCLHPGRIDQRPPASPAPWHPLFHIISMIAFPLIYSVYTSASPMPPATSPWIWPGRKPATR